MQSRISYVRAAAPLAIVAALFTGCAEKHCAPVTLTGTVPGDGFMVEQAQCPPTGYVILEAEPSQGRFPSALAVARVELARNAGGTAASDGWQIASPKVEETSYWHTTFTAVPAIREVIICDGLSTPPGPQEAGAIARAAQSRDAAVCLVYARVDAEAGRAAFAGILFETTTAKPIACVRADAGPEDFETPRTDRPSQDLRHVDVEYLGARKLEAQVRDCLAALQARDRASATTQPSPWHNAMPPPNTPIIVIPSGRGLEQWPR